MSRRTSHSYLLSSARRRWAKNLLLVGLLTALLGWGSPPVLQGQQNESMSSESYLIQLGNFNTTSGEKSGGGYNVTDTVGQLAPGEYTSTGYKVFAGFQYLYALPEFRFQIFNLSMPLGELTIGQFAQNSHQLMISTRSGGYTILAQADHELRLAGGPSADAIPHTSCDSSCTISTAGVWTNPQNAGFGFTVSGTHASSDFVDSTYFRPFADAEDGQTSQPIAEHNGVVNNDLLTVGYRASIDSSQAAGSYATTIDYIALPTY